MEVDRQQVNAINIHMEDSKGLIVLQQQQIKVVVWIVLSTIGVLEHMLVPKTYRIRLATGLLFTYKINH